MATFQSQTFQTQAGYGGLSFQDFSTQDGAAFTQVIRPILARHVDTPDHIITDLPLLQGGHDMWTDPSLTRQQQDLQVCLQLNTYLPA